MTHITLYYNSFEPTLKIIRDGQAISPYSALKRMCAKPLSSWIELIFPALYQEVNARYDVRCAAMPFAGALLREAAMREGHCADFQTVPPPLPWTVCERLNWLSASGRPEPQAFRTPICNASGEATMWESVREALEESGLFSSRDSRTMEMNDAPAEVQLVFARSREELSQGRFYISLCASPRDGVPDADIPSFALVMGRETRVLRRQGKCLFLSVDSDRLPDVIQSLLEEEVLCPLLRKSRDRLLSERNGSVLPDDMQERLELLCRITPVCVADLPQRIDAGREEAVQVSVFPSGTEIPVRVKSSAPETLVADGLTLRGVSRGRATVSVFLGDDPYPAASREISVTNRRLIQSVKLFPSALYLPVGGEKTLSLSFLPEDAENHGEIVWRSSDSAVAEVSPAGRVAAVGVGRCEITASTREAEARCAAFVQPVMEDIFVPGYYVETTPGSMVEWKCKAVPADAYGAQSVSADSSNREIAEYTGGYIRAKKPGDCRIFIRAKDCPVTKEIRVKVKRKGFFR